MIGLAFILLLVIISISTLVIDAATHNSIYNEFVVKQDLVNRLKGPSAKHIFGQDEFGRDMLLRMLWGARYSLFTGGIAIILALCAGGMAGSVFRLLRRKNRHNHHASDGYSAGNSFDASCNRNCGCTWHKHLECYDCNCNCIHSDICPYRPSSSSDS